LLRLLQRAGAVLALFFFADRFVTDRRGVAGFPACRFKS
jgi:hypothetical protein